MTDKIVKWIWNNYRGSIEDLYLYKICNFVDQEENFSPIKLYNFCKGRIENDLLDKIVSEINLLENNKCPNDTNGDGDCHKCTNRNLDKQEGCFYNE